MGLPRNISSSAWFSSSPLGVGGGNGVFEGTTGWRKHRLERTGRDLSPLSCLVWDQLEGVRWRWPMLGRIELNGNIRNTDVDKTWDLTRKACSLLKLCFRMLWTRRTLSHLHRWPSSLQVPVPIGAVLHDLDAPVIQPLGSAAPSSHPNFHPNNPNTLW